MLAMLMTLGLLVLPGSLGISDTSAASTTVVISQFQVLGDGTERHADEFVELHNVSASSVDLNGMRLVYRSARGTTDVNLRDWSVSTLIPPGGYYLLGHTQGYDGPAADATFGANNDNGALSMSGGGLALREGANNTGTIIDSVGYGSATNAFVETVRTVAPPANAARARGSNGCTDTDDNAADFGAMAPSSPRNSGTPRFVCGSAPELRLLKAAGGATYEAVGEVISYTYQLTNSGNVRLGGPLRVNDDRISVDCPSASSVGNGDSYLDPDEEMICTASDEVTLADLDAGTLTNVAYATATAQVGDPVRSNLAEVTVTARQSPALYLSKWVSGGNPYDAVGDVVSYRYRLTNIGNVTLSAPYLVTDDTTTASCPPTPVSLAPGASVTCTATYSVSQGELDAGSLTNLASATAKHGPDEITSNEAMATAFARTDIQLILDKTITGVESD